MTCACGTVVSLRSRSGVCVHCQEVNRQLRQLAAERARGPERAALKRLIRQQPIETARVVDGAFDMAKLRQRWTRWQPEKWRVA